MWNGTVVLAFQISCLTNHAVPIDLSDTISFAKSHDGCQSCWKCIKMYIVEFHRISNFNLIQTMLYRLFQRFQIIREITQVDNQLTCECSYMHTTKTRNPSNSKVEKSRGQIDVVNHPLYTVFWMLSGGNLLQCNLVLCASGFEKWLRFWVTETYQSFAFGFCMHLTIGSGVVSMYPMLYDWCFRPRML